MTDKQLQTEILAELECAPGLHPERLGVAVEHGVVTLFGHVDSYAQKLEVERVVKRVYSAKAVADELEVRLPARDEVDDTKLAQDALQAIAAFTDIPPDTIRITVREGHLILEGKVDHSQDRTAAEAAVCPLRGVRGVANHISTTQETVAA